MNKSNNAFIVTIINDLVDNKKTCYFIRSSNKITSKNTNM